MGERKRKCRLILVEINNGCGSRWKGIDKEFPPERMKLKINAIKWFKIKPKWGNVGNFRDLYNKVNI